MEAFQEIEVGVALADTSGIKSSIAVRLLIGQGNLLSMTGRYDKALAPLAKAEGIAARLDNRTLHAECAAQLAMVEGRLGRPAIAVRWARAALAQFGPVDWCASSLMAAYELGLGLLADGQIEEAREAVRALSRLSEHDAPNWAVQAGLLFEADVTALSGNPRRAFALARKGTSGALSELQNVAYAGQYARWIALVGAHDGNARIASERLCTAFPDSTLLDSKDQAELIAARAFLNSRLGVGNPTQYRDLEERLDKLPPTIRTTIRRLGLYEEKLGRQ